MPQYTAAMPLNSLQETSPAPMLTSALAGAAAHLAPPSLDPVAAARWQRVLQPQSPWLHEEVARRMEARLDWITLQPRTWLHWAPVSGGLLAHENLARRYPKSECFIVEAEAKSALHAMKSIAKPWWQPAHWRRATPQWHAPPPVGVEMLWANMALHMSPDPRALLQQWHARLAPGGFLMFSCLGPDTMTELRSAYRSQGWPAPAHAFTDMHDWGDMLLAAGFAEPVMDMERMRLSYPSAERLLSELRTLGRNLHRQRGTQVRGRAWLAQLHSLLSLSLAAPQSPGRLDLSFEIIYGHAFKALPRPAALAGGAAVLQDMRGLRRPR